MELQFTQANKKLSQSKLNPGTEDLGWICSTAILLPKYLSQYEQYVPSLLIKYPLEC
ncbi:hypothetical protein D3C85_1658210 [compost metagenome]